MLCLLGACGEEEQIREERARAVATPVDSLQAVRTRVRTALNGSGDLEKEGQRLLRGNYETNAQAAGRLADEALRVSRNYRMQSRARRDGTLVPEVVEMEQRVQRLRSAMNESTGKSKLEKIQAVQVPLIELQLSARRAAAQQQQRTKEQKVPQKKWP